MRNVFSIVFIIFLSTNLFAQVRTGQGVTSPYNSDLTPEEYRDSLQRASERTIKVEIEGKTHFTDYKIISHSFDTTLIDTTLNIKKYYKFNFINKDNFELMAFQNMGQTFNKLGYKFESPSIIPELGMNSKFYNYKKIEDIKYYRVPTPTSELYYRSALEQGQLLNAFFTANTSPNLNLSFSFKGLRSLGKYRRSLVSNSDFRVAASYNSKNKKYNLRSHYAAHNFSFEENGGLTAQSDEFFRSGNSNYSDRGRLDVNFDDAESKLLGKRYYLEHSYKLIEEKDTVKTKLTNLTLGHIYSYETKHYGFDMTQNDLLGDAFEENVNDETGLKEMNNQLYAELNSPKILGNFRAKGNYYRFSHFYNGVVFLPGQTIDQNLKGTALSGGVDWNATIKSFNFKASASSILAGDLKGNNFIADANYTIDSISSVRASISLISKSPNYNFLHSQSGYVDYNWQNDDFNNEKIRNISFEFISDKWLNASASISQIDNYTYFDENSSPTQAPEALNYLKVKVSKEFTFGKFALDNTLMYNNVSKGQAFFRVPEFVTRNSIYYTNFLFKNKPMYLQTGVTFKYFTSYYMNNYNPLLSEFTIQNTEKFGNFPVFDVFANFQVRRTRFYAKLENVTASFTGRNYYSAPYNPYRDLVFRFGLVWDFFI